MKTARNKVTNPSIAHVVNTGSGKTRSTVSKHLRIDLSSWEGIGQNHDAIDLHIDLLDIETKSKRLENEIAIDISERGRQISCKKSF